VYFPNLPLCRLIRHYGADGLQGREAERDDEGHKEKCTKYSDAHPKLTPGIFTCHCVHGYNLGFKLMDRHEGPSTPFQMFMTRFPEAPGLLIYDNGCNLTRYYFKREAAFFKNTRVVVDKLHCANHTACPRGFRLNMYPEDFEILPGLQGACTPLTHR
jgi:hypothetical protein